MESMAGPTGARGFIGSWLVKKLLRRGYAVRGTARDPDDHKNVHLRALDGAKERLSLYRADVLDYKSLRAAFCLCDGVFHVACPVSNDPEVVAAAVEGTKNVVNAAADMGVKRVVFTSSYGAVLMDPYRSPDQTVDESCWSHLNFCNQTKNLYCYARTAAERTSTEESSRRGIQLLALVPAVTIGEMLHPTLSVSTAMVARYMTGAKTTFPDAVDAYVDVQDVARAHVLVYEDTASSGRYHCVADVLHRSEVLRMMRELFPQYPITAKCVDAKPKVKPFKFSAQRLQDLGLKFTPLKESLYRTMIYLQGKGHVPILLSHSGIGQHLKVE